MRWLVIFESKPGVDSVRKAHYAAHLDYLQAHPEISLAGSVADPETGAGFGGVWIIDGVDHATAIKLCEEDPFFVADTRKSYRLFAYDTASFYEGKF